MAGQHLTDIGPGSACTLWTHHRQQKALSSVELALGCRVVFAEHSVVDDLVADTGPLSRRLTDLTLLPTFKLDSKNKYT